MFIYRLSIKAFNGLVDFDVKVSQMHTNKSNRRPDEKLKYNFFNIYLQNQEGLPPHIRKTIYFMTVILPPVSYLVLTLTFLIGSYFLAKHLYIHQFNNETMNALLHFKSKNTPSNIDSNILKYEKEIFIKLPR